MTGSNNTRQGANGIGRVIDCAANPLDLRPAVDAIMESIVRARASLRADEPLFVPITEAHSMPTHIMLQAALLKALRGEYGRDKIAFGTEQPHNALGACVDSFDVYIPAGVGETLSTLDQNGARFLKAGLACADYNYAPVSRWSLEAFLLHQDIVTHFNDTARYNNALDLRDTFTQQVLKDYIPEEFDDVISAHSPYGMFLRNMFMVRSVLQKQNALVYVQQLGSTHLLGNAEHEYAHSVSHILMEAQKRVLPVFVKEDALGPCVIPPNALKMLRQGVVVEGLSQERFYGDAPMGDEGRFVSRVVESSRMQDCEIVDWNNPAYEVDRDRLYAKIERQIPRWLAEAGMGL